ncbi:hypothetical protein SERLA73DRAFT_165070 [Serpula lacrymans var. lacrymans S7.3]|uniref:Uncharacterized protein n=2 Tax=Serpula lacrymans var. lacrymans TaxID=341189 RepID=F8PKK9_SERL3|nr:uncharacterized protein SERLADRAFT_412745 [Serpula lacrymans var. lacrymans S7.9]EGO03343.1 hypothetical protein SERLA73DRAFT_165070 [Serpula lacrymans var. lacrymans S7.3]EGO29116.1 hypothetical protein SERLADRAFT_412745 [Serpula lacrymans var. lacrymans S7.9]
MSSISATSSPITTVLGKWHRVSNSSTDVDLEAQIITGTRVPLDLPSVPSPVHSAAAPTRTPESNNTSSDPIDDFFGVTRSRATCESRHDSHSLTSRFSTADADEPPPYAYGVEPPAYASTAEPVTLAMYLFKFGFVFPLFWLLGAIILVSPLSAPADFEPSKTEGERQELVQKMRATELKWAKRCAWALVILLLAVAVIVGIAVGVMKS